MEKRRYHRKAAEDTEEKGLLAKTLCSGLKSPDSLPLSSADFRLDTHFV
jgi:hypothetical protein